MTEALLLWALLSASFSVLAVLLLLWVEPRLVRAYFALIRLLERKFKGSKAA